MKTAVVDVKSAWASKINWVSLIGVIAMIGSFFGLDLDTATQAALVTAIGTISGVITMVLRTFFTKTITPQSANKV